MTRHLTRPELAEAVTLLCQQVYRQALPNLGQQEVRTSATVQTKAAGPVLRLELRLTVAQPSGPVPDGGQPILVDHRGMA